VKKLLNTGTSNKTKTPVILEIKGNSLDDGPGIRSVIFFKGCPLSCLWCHNPESKKAGIEISFDSRTCVGCNTCIKICPVAALSRDNPHFISRDLCTLCFKCADACPSGALAKVGAYMSVKEIVDVVIRDKPFYDTSGGGVTLSGGEPALFMEFISKLLRALKKNGIHTLLETCGLFDFDSFKRTVYPHLDMIYYDIKIFDNNEHKRYCGASNNRIIENFTKLLPLAKKDGKILIPRTPLVPGVTDSDTNISAIADFLKGLDVHKAAILPYNPLWHEKNAKIGADDPFAGKKSMRSFMDKNGIEHIKRIFRGRDIET
jgi:pyruvate formate lyase activating enzyme